jgi:hypothetical protein
MDIETVSQRAHEKVYRSWVLRGDQVDRLAQLKSERPGTALNEIVREIIDLGMPEYSRQRAVIAQMRQTA